MFYDKESRIWTSVGVILMVAILVGKTAEIIETDKQQKQNVISFVNEALGTNNAEINKVSFRGWSRSEYEVIAGNKIYNAYLNQKTKEIKLVIVAEVVETNTIEIKSQEENPSTEIGGHFQ